MNTTSSRIVLIIYALFIGFASLQPMPVDNAPIEHWDKILHFGAYGLFGMLAYPAAHTRRQYLFLCAGIVIYSGTMEIAQSFMPDRVMSTYDLLANTLGLVLAAAILTRKPALQKTIR